MQSFTATSNPSLCMQTQCWKPNAGNPMLETQCWKPIAGNPMPETQCWKPIAGNPMPETQCWKPNAGNPMLETQCWKPNAGNPMLETQCWKPKREARLLGLPWLLTSRHREEASSSTAQASPGTSPPTGAGASSGPLL